MCKAQGLQSGNKNSQNSQQLKRRSNWHVLIVLSLDYCIFIMFQLLHFNYVSIDRYKIILFCNFYLTNKI